MRILRLLISILAVPVMGMVLIYRWFISPLLPQCCRFQPTCSAYGLEALEKHGVLRGSVLTVRRISKCHPWGSSGFDPVPATKECRNK